MQKQNQNQLNKKMTKHVITKNVAPLTVRDALKKFTISALIKRFTTDANGIIQNPVPVVFQKPLPFHLWGDYDKNGGYQIADLVTQQFDTILMDFFTVGINTPFFFAAPFNNINAQFKKGDIVFHYVDDLNNPNFHTFVIISARQGGFGSLVSQSNVSQIDDNGNWGVFKVDHMRFIWENDEQLYLPFFTIKTQFNGRFESNSFLPIEYRNNIQQEDVKNIIIPTEFLCSQYFGLSGYIDWQNPTLELVFVLYL